MKDKGKSSITTSALLTSNRLFYCQNSLMEYKRILEDESKFKSPKETVCKNNILIDSFDEAVIRRLYFSYFNLFILICFIFKLLL